MNKSLWLDFPNIKSFPKLEDDIEVDIAIIGGGITGISCGLSLAEEGFSVAIIERSKIFHSTTGNTTAKITIQHDLLYNNLINKFGLDKALQYADINTKAIKKIQGNIKDYEIECNFEFLPAYIYTKEDKYINKIEQEYEAAKKLNIDAFLVDELNLPFKTKKAIGFKNQAQFHITKYLDKLIENFTHNDDNYIFENTRVTNIKEDNNFCHTFTENGRKIKSRQVLVATHYPIHSKLNFYFTRLKPSTSYLIAVKHQVPLEKGIYKNAEDPVRSLRNQVFNDENLLLISGEKHETGHFDTLGETHYKNLYDFGKKYFKANKLMYKWMTQDFYSLDKVPYIGKINKNAKNVYVATGFNKWGMTSSVVASIILKDLITYGKSDYQELFNPSRGCVLTSGEFIKYNLTSAKRFVLDRLKSAPKISDLKKEEGKIIKIRNKKYGAYKDSNGELFVVNIICPHLGCLLDFNQAEKTYDCPCHGSRFTYKGEYIDGPANVNLKRIDVKNIEIK